MDTGISIIIGAIITWLVTWLYFRRSTKQLEQVHCGLKIQFEELLTIVREYKKHGQEAVNSMQSFSPQKANAISKKIEDTQKKEAELIQSTIEHTDISSHSLLGPEASDWMKCPTCGKKSLLIGIYPASPNANVGYKCPEHGVFMGGRVDGWDD